VEFAIFDGMIIIHTFNADANNGFVGEGMWHRTSGSAGSAVTPSWSCASTAVWIALWVPFSVGILALSDVNSLVAWFWLTDTVVDGKGLVFEGGTISATCAGIPSETIAAQTFWVAVLWEALVGRCIISITSLASLALCLSWTSAAIAGFVANVLVAFSTGVSLHALAGLTRRHGDEDGVITACGTVIVTIVIAISANVGADDAFSFTEDSRGIA